MVAFSKMADNPSSSHTKVSIDEFKSLIGSLGEAISLRDSESEAHAQTRSGPLQVVGRLYVALTTLIALSSSLSAYLDHQAGITLVTRTTGILRIALAFAVIVGIVGGAWVVVFLARRHPVLLFSPTELSAGAHSEFIHRGVAAPHPNKEGPKSDSIIKTSELLPPDDSKSAMEPPTEKPTPHG